MMDVKGLIKINNKVLVSLAHEPGNYYSSRIEDINGDIIGLSLPTKYGRAMPLHKNMEINVSVMTDKSRIGFKSKIIDMIIDKIPIINIKMPETYNIEQLRHYFRVPVHLRVAVFTGKFEELKKYLDEQNAPEMMRGVLTDLSGGGCAISVDLNLNIGDNLVLDFSGTPIGVGYVSAKVIRSVPKQDGSHLFSLEFINIEERERDRIVRYIFRRQLELRNLELSEG